MTERWLPVVGYEGYYEVSDHGRVRSVTRTIHTSNGQTKVRQGRPMRLTQRPARPTTTRRYQKVELSMFAVAKSWSVHVLVAAAYIGPRPVGYQVCHANDDGFDNRVSNLRYDTPSENRLDVTRGGRNPKANLTHCPQGHPYDAANTYVSPTSTRRHRQCRICMKNHAVKRKARNAKTLVGTA